jgi:hypothetical protein
MDEIQRAALVLSRYLTVRACFTGGEVPLPSIGDIEYMLRQQQQLICRVFVEPTKSPILDLDYQAEEFLEAINGQGTYPKIETVLMDQLRKHVYEDGPMPTIPGGLRRE